MSDIYLPLLEFLSDNKSIYKKNLNGELTALFELTTAQKSETTPGGVKKFSSRVDWVCFDLKGAGLISKKDNMISITDEGQKLLTKKPKKITRKFLKENVPTYEKWISQKSKSREEGKHKSETESKSPLDIIDEQHEIIKNGVKAELLERIFDKDSGFFEVMTLQLVRAMGYGISDEVLGQPHDGGIDGVITEDKLKFNQIYLQAKRRKDVVSVREVRDFVGALVSTKSDKGIFITSSNFTDDARKYVKTINQKVVLIDGDKLTNLMYDNNVGVSVSGGKYEIKQVDEEFFD